MDARIDHLHSLRSYELELVINYLKRYFSDRKDIRILEIGAGTGWQAEQLSRLGYFVDAIDLPSSNYRDQRVFKVLDYDGNTIDYKDDYFDVIYSSNVLEHVPHIKSFQFEMKRVLKKDGICIHLMPSSSWRIWTSFTYYLRAIKITLFSRKKDDLIAANSRKDYKSNRRRNTYTKFFPSLHGEKGNFITEIYYFSAFYWRLLFSSNEWELLDNDGNKIFYTGNFIFGSHLPINLRKYLHFIFGSSCNIFVLKNKL